MFVLAVGPRMRIIRVPFGSSLLFALTACSSNASRRVTETATSTSNAADGSDSTLIAFSDVDVGDIEVDDSGGLSTTTADVAPSRCDEAGLNCKCIAIANIGAIGTSGTTTSYDTWLNTQSNARVDDYPTENTIDAPFLANYDELVFQDISIWTISSDEVDTIITWVQAGGGLMSMNGYQGSPTEITNINLILAPLGFAYSATPGDGGVLWQTVNGWNSSSPIATNMDGYGVNVHNGRPVIDQTGTATLVIAQALGSDTYNLGYTNVVGAGHVFPWCDEWVTYSSEWDDDTGTLRVEQFWYNTVQYLTPTNACKVVINDSHIIVN